ncbi:hypothetical protein MRB53_040510 [Persea americana]|nr:hypothetical protein MRB53_040510 [Persea americana]
MVLPESRGLMFSPHRNPLARRGPHAICPKNHVACRCGAVVQSECRCGGVDDLNASPKVKLDGRAGDFGRRGRYCSLAQRSMKTSTVDGVVAILPCLTIGRRHGKGKACLARDQIDLCDATVLQTPMIAGVNAKSLEEAASVGAHMYSPRRSRATFAIVQNTCTSWPCWRSATAAVRPPMPPPAMRMRSGWGAGSVGFGPLSGVVRDGMAYDGVTVTSIALRGKTAARIGWRDHGYVHAWRLR